MECILFLPEAKANSKIAFVAILATAVGVMLLLLAAAYLPTPSFSQAIPFLPKAQSNIATNTNHRIIPNNNNNNTKTSSNEVNNKPLSSGKTNSYSYSVNDNNKVTNNATKLKSLSSQKTNTATTINEIIKLSNKEQLDKFGIAKLYPTKPNGEEWYMNMSNPISDPRFDLNNQYKHVGKSSALEFNFIKTADGSWKVTSPKVRIESFTSTGYNQSKITTYNQTELTAKVTCNRLITGKM